jgi:hypothetical protein
VQFKPCMVFKPAALAVLLAWPALASAVKVGVINVAPSGAVVKLKVATEGLVKPEISVLGPDKVLIVVPQGQRDAMSPLKVRAGVVKGIRFGNEEGDLRIVVDLSSAAGASLAGSSPKGFSVDITADKKAASAPAAKAEAAPEAEIGALNPANAAYTFRVVDLYLGGGEDQGELVISSDGPASYKSSLKEDGRLLSLSFRNSSLAWAGDGARLSDASVSGVTVKQLSEGGEAVVKVDVRLREKLAYRLTRDQNQLVVRFDRPEQQAEIPKSGNLQALVSLDVEDTDMVGVLKALCQQAGFEYQFTSSLLLKVPPDSLVTLKVNNRPFKEVVDTILAQASSSFVQQGNTLYIGSDPEIALRKAKLPTVQRFYEPKYLSALELAGLLNAHFSRETQLRTIYFLDPRDSSRFMMVGTAQDVSEVMAAIARYDAPEAGEQAASAEEGGGGNRPRTQVFHLQYLDASHQGLIFAAIAQLYPAGETLPNPTLDAATRILVVTTPLKYLRKIEKLLARLDVKPPQVNIEGRIVEMNQGYAQEFGINWSAQQLQASPNANLTVNPSQPSAFPAQITYATIQNGFNINACLQAAVSEHKADLVSAPNITTSDNVTALISTTDTNVSVQSNIVFNNGVSTQTTSFVQYSIPLVLQVTPKISMADKRIDLNINFGLTTASGSAVVEGAPLPTSRQQAITNVNVNSGDTAVIGGLVRQNNIENERKVPVLGDIPLLGLLFKFNTVSKEKKEVIIFITPTIVED